MLEGHKFEVKRNDEGPLTINSFLKEKNSGFDTFRFEFSGQADSKFLAKLSKLIKSEQKPKNESRQSTQTDK